MAEIVQFDELRTARRTRQINALIGAYAEHDYPLLHTAWGGLQRAGLPMERRVRVSASLHAGSDEAYQALEGLGASHGAYERGAEPRECRSNAWLRKGNESLSVGGVR
jgi:hypothetical protein